MSRERPDLSAAQGEGSGGAAAPGPAEPVLETSPPENPPAERAQPDPQGQPDPPPDAAVSTEASQDNVTPVGGETGPSEPDGAPQPPDESTPESVPNVPPPEPQTATVEPPAAISPPPPVDVPEWANIVEDISVPDELELKEYEGKMLDTSALDVKYHEDLFYTEHDDPEQRPVKKIRLTWTIRGLRGNKDKPNRARVMNSPAAHVDGYYWTIRFFPRGNNSSALSAYIKCSKKPPKPDKEPQKGTFSFVHGAPDADLKDAKPEGETTFPAEAPTSVEGDAAEGPEEKPAADADKTQGDAPPPAPANTSETPESTQTGEGEADEEEDWRVSAQIGMIIYNPAEPRTKYEMSSEHQFNKHNDDWGWTNFHGPWSEIHRRRPGQYQALLRDDALAVDAYIRVFDDPTQALWWHESQDSEKYWDSKSLTGYFPMGTPPLYHSPGVAGITAWLLLAPFRKVMQGVDTSRWRTESNARPRPLVCQIQLVLYMMRYMRKEENYVNVHSIIEHMGALGESWADVVTFWEAFRRSIEIELEGSEAVKEIADIFDGGSDAGCSPPPAAETLLVPVENVSSVQAGVERTLGDTEKKVWPKFLPIQLDRQKFDATQREWKLLYNRVKIDEELDLSRWSREESRGRYTLYGFMVHVGERTSGKFYSVLRPNGPGDKWLAFEDGDGNKVFSYTKRRIEEFEGLDAKDLESNKSTRQTAYLVMYIRSDVLKEFLPGSLEPYSLPSWLHHHLPSPCTVNGKKDEPKAEESNGEVQFEIYPSTNVSWMQGLIDMHKLRYPTAVPNPPLTLAVPPATTYAELRQKIAKWQQIDNPQKIRLWTMRPGPLGERLQSCLDPVRLHRPINGYSNAVLPICLWMHVLQSDEDADLFGFPDPPLDHDPFARTPPSDSVTETSQSQVAADWGGDPETAHSTPAGSTPEGQTNASETSTSETTTEQAAPDQVGAAVADAVAATVSSIPVGATSSDAGITVNQDEPATSSGDAEPPSVAEETSPNVDARPEDSTTVSPAEGSRENPRPPVDGPESPQEGPTTQESPANVGDIPTPRAAEPERPQTVDAESTNISPDADAHQAETTETAPAAGAEQAAQAQATEEDAATHAGEDLTPAETPTASEASGNSPDDAEAVLAAVVVADAEARDGGDTAAAAAAAAATTTTTTTTTEAAPASDQAEGRTEPSGDATAIQEEQPQGPSQPVEEPRPVKHFYGFVQVFDAQNQNFRIHGDFMARDYASIKETLRRLLDYPEDRDFSIWLRTQPFQTTKVPPTAKFHDYEDRHGGYALIVGEALSDSM